jgi:hypothetical protein
LRGHRLPRPIGADAGALRIGGLEVQGICCAPLTTRKKRRPVSDSRRLVRRDYGERGRLNDMNGRTSPKDAGDGLVKVILTTATLGV